MRCDTLTPEGTRSTNATTLAMPSAEVRKRSARSEPSWVFTGGEPLLQQQALDLGDGHVPCIRHASKWKRTVHVSPGCLVGWSVVTVSPNWQQPVPYGQRIRPQALRRLMSSGKAVFKFVAAEQSDLEEVALLERDLGLAPIWIMPEGTQAEVVLTHGRELADPVLERGWNLTTRLHTLLWGDERGR